MATYEFFFIRCGAAICKEVRDCKDDLDALVEAKSRAEECDVEVWQSKKMVAHVKRGDAPADPGDPVSG